MITKNKDGAVIKIELVMGSPGDSIVGLPDWDDTVTLSFESGMYFEQEDIEFLRQTFAELADGWCVLKDEYDAEMKKMNDFYEKEGKKYDREIEEINDRYEEGKRENGV